MSTLEKLRDSAIGAIDDLYDRLIELDDENEELREKIEGLEDQVETYKQKEEEKDREQAE